MMRRIASLALAATTLSACGLVVQRQAPDPAVEETRVAEDDAEAGVIELARFFGDCDDATQGVTDVSQATSECEVIQILTNAFNADNAVGIDVEQLGGAQFASYYDTLNATYAGGSPPDVAVMHASNLPDYASRDLLVQLDDVMGSVDVDPSIWTEPAREAVTYDGATYGVPFDVHANLWHVNVDLMDEAGLVDADGIPILPSSPEEFLAQAVQLEEATGAQYFATDANQFALDVMVFISLLYQNGGDIVSEDGSHATLDTPEAREVLEFMNTLFDEGIADPQQDYTAAQSAFLSGDVAVLHNGTWVVNQYAAEAPFEYRTMPFPGIFGEPANWSNSHVWVIPVQSDPGDYKEALEFVGYLDDHVADWAVGTGHLPPKEPVLASDEFASAPQRSNFASATVEQAQLLPSVGNWQPIEDIIKREIEATWLTGKSVDQALQDAQREIDIRLDATNG